MPEDKKISQRDSAGTLTGSEIIGLIQSDVDVQAPLDDVTDFIGASILPYKSYVAFFDQSGTGDPTVTVIVNELSGPIVWTRTGTGQYSGTLAGAFTIGKTISYFTLSTPGNLEVAGQRQNSDSFLVQKSNSTGTLSDTLSIYIEIRVYN